MSDSASNLERCLRCKHSRDRNPENGTLTCQRHSMLIDDKADEIPDDCVEFEPEQTARQESDAAHAPKPQ